jgi:membrane protease YdiL (CAAX protease family)
MRYGWFPITVSSAAFGLAHFGYGPEPIPLFLLALVLGFLYQRTHRIIPSIVAHGLFNMFSMIILWRTVYHG